MYCMSFNTKQLVDFTTQQTEGIEDFPFNGPNSNEKIIWYIVRHPENKKIIAMVFVKDNTLLINLKLTADHVEHAITIKGVTRGYHMNKQYWISIDVNNTEISKDELQKMLQESSKLTD